MSQSSQFLVCSALSLLLGVCFAILLLRYWHKLAGLKRIEKELARLQAFSGGLPDLVAIIDADLCVIDVIAHKNAVPYRPINDVLGKTLYEFMPPATTDIIQRTIQDTIATQSIQTAEYSLPFVDRVRWFEGRSLLLPSAASEKPSVLWIPREITDRKHVEKAVLESEARFRSIFDHSPVGILTADTTGLVTDLNAAYLNIIGDPDLHDAIVAKHNLLDNLILQQAGIQHLFQNLYDNLEPLVAEAQVTTMTGLQKMLRYHATPQLSKTGEFIGCVLICEDITDRIDAEKSLRDSEARYRTISELISDFACAFSVDERQNVTAEWVTTSFERMTSFTVDEIFKKSAWRELLDADDIERVEGVFRLLVTTAEHTTITVRIHTKSSDVRHVQAHFRSIWDDEQQRVTQIVGAGTDITERIEADAKDRELAAHRQQVDLLANFISNMSHHFKNPLSVVNTEIALMHSLQIHHIEPNLQKIERQVAHISHIFAKLALLAQLDHDPNFEFIVRDVNFVLLELEVSVLHIAARRNINIDFQMPKNLPSIRLDDQWLSRALYELLENAIFHSPDDGRVQVSVTVDEKSVAIAITDDGDGISAEHLPHLFKRFYKTDEARTNVERPGIGLTIAKHVVEEHKGTITVTSDIGKGSTWVVKLPITVSSTTA